MHSCHTVVGVPRQALHEQDAYTGAGQVRAGHVRAGQADLIGTEVEVPQLAALQGVAHVGGLLFASQRILPDVDTPAPAHRQHAPLANITPAHMFKSKP